MGRCMLGPVCGLLAALLAGCASQPTERNPDTSRWRASGSFLLVGDTQEHEIGGLPSTLAGGVADSLNEVTIRQPFHGVFGRKLLEFLGQQHRDLPLVHLGDLLDLSCQSEFARMEESLRAVGGPLAIAPGNHDGLLNGIFNLNARRRQWGIGPVTWRLRCAGPDELPNGPQSVRNDSGNFIDEHRDYQKDVKNDDFWSAFRLTKDSYIRRYISLLEKREGFSHTSSACPEDPFCSRVGWDIRDRGQPGPVVGEGVVHGSAFTTKHDDTEGRALPPFTRSWLVQKFVLPSASAGGASTALILIDTTNPASRATTCDPAAATRSQPRSTTTGSDDLPEEECFTTTLSALDRRNPGFMGYVSADQRLAISRMLQESNEEVIVIAGHHDWKHIWPGDREAIARSVHDLGRPIVYLSAHTHTGFWMDHMTSFGAPVLELNVSSLADWPLASRVVRFKRSLDGKNIAVEAGVSPQVKDDAIGNKGALLQAWERASCAAAMKQVHPTTSFEMLSNDVRSLVVSHRRGRASFMDTLKVGSVTVLSIAGLVEKSSSETWTRAMYVDAINDLRHALRAASLAAHANPDFAQALFDSNDQLRTGCGAASLGDCVDQQLKEAEKLKQTRKVFDAMFLTYRPVSIAISKVHEPKRVSYMACLAAIGAHEDWLQSGESPTLHNTFYYEQRVTR